MPSPDPLESVPAAPGPSPERRRLLVLVAVGTALVVLGGVNQALGRAKLAEYTQVIELLRSSEATARSETQRRLDTADRKLSFYTTVERGGGWLTLAGVACILLGFLLALVDSRTRAPLTEETAEGGALAPPPKRE